MSRRLSESLVDLFVDSVRAADAVMDEAMRVLGDVGGSSEAGASDQAVREWANRALRRAALPELGRPGPRGVLEDLLDAARSTGAPAATLPFALPLAAARLFGDQMLRAEPVLRTVRPAVLPGFLRFVAKTWSDLPIYFTLQYGEALALLERRLDERPRDPDVRYALAMTLLECGHFREAAEHFEALSAAERQARHWALVARVRAGDFESALEHGRHHRAEKTATGRLWLHLAAEGAAGGSAADSDETLHVMSRGQTADFELEEVSEALGLRKVSGGRGTAVADLTGDGTLDLVIAGAHSGLSFFRNRGDGLFEDATAGSGLDTALYAFAISAADYDNDGRNDLFATGLGFYDGQGLLYRNVGGGRFEEVTADAGLDLWGPGFTASWVDYDLDGWLDLFVVNNLGGLFDRKAPNRLFRNNRDGTFTEVTAESGLVTPWPSLGHCWGDFTNDGLPDLFLSNFGRAQLFKNQGDGTFKDISRQAGLDHPCVGSVAVAVDLDQNGWLDIVQLTYSRPEDAIWTLEHGRAPDGATPPRVWRNRGDGTFHETGAEFGLDGAWGTMSANLGDLANRGRLDLVLGNGDPSMDRVEPTVVYSQDVHGRFRDVTGAVGLPLWGKGHGVNLADFTGRGHQHLVVSHGGLYPGDLMRTTVHRARGAPGRELGHFINLRLRATRGHHQAIGARLRVEAGGQVQHLHLSPGSAFGWKPLDQHVGLGPDVSRVDRIEVRWPGGGIQKFKDLPADAAYELVEGEAKARRRPEAGAETELPR
ncbi:MAG: FG-GAP-like repeat-containing protein [Acidobacteriota bacterium]